MATRAVGLDIGSFAVRAAEVTIGGERPTLQRFGQVTLPPGAVRNGEVVEPDTVGAAIRRLWTEGGFRTKQVVVGVANQRVIVRQADVPAMNEDDMRSALQFEAQELIPIPIDEAILDFQILENVSGPEGEPMSRILLAAAQQDMIRSHLAAVESGGLRAATVDLVPFALIRSLWAPTANDFLADTRDTEAILSVGAGVTTVVVHERGIPRFVRILVVGGDDVTQAIASELDVDVDLAEDLKRRADEGSPDPAVAEAGRLLTAGLTPIVEEIRGSLDFYQAQADAGPLRRVLVTGGGSRMPALVERLQQVLGGTVETAQPLDGLRIGRVGLSEDQLREAEPLLAVPVGLALAGAPLEKGARRITLMPTEVAVVRERRRQLVLTGSAVAGFFALLLVLWLARGLELTRERNRAEEAERRNAALEQEVAALQDVVALETDLRERQRVVRVVLEDDVAWTRLLQEVATVIPNDVWLTSFTGTKGEPGTVTFAAMGFDQSSAARWLLRVGELASLSGVWVPSSTKPPGEGAQALVTFSSTANLTEQARSDRAERIAGAGE